VAPHEGVRTPRYTLAHYYESGEWELFDREKDPAQMRSVYGDAAYADTVRSLRLEMARLREALQAPDPAGRQ
jgi:hypothetical protein